MFELSTGDDIGERTFMARRTKAGACLGRSRFQQLRELPRDAGSGLRLTEILGSDGDKTRARAQQISGVGPALHAAHADDRNRDRGGDRVHLCERGGADRRTEIPPVMPPSHGSPVRGSSAMPADRVDQRDGVGAGLLRGARDRRRRRTRSASA